MVGGALLTVAAGNMPVVTSSAFGTSARLVVAFSLARVLTNLTVEFYHRSTSLPNTSSEVGSL